jgi:hypothetical protein
MPQCAARGAVGVWIPLTFRVAARLVKRGARGARAQRPSAKTGFAHISLCIFKFRLGDGIIESWKKGDNPLRVIAFHVGAGIIGTASNVVVSPDAPRYYG